MSNPEQRIHEPYPQPVRPTFHPYDIHTSFNPKSDKARKKSLSTALLALLTAGAYAQGGDGIAGITEATSMVTSYFYPLVQLIYAIGAVTGLIGGIRVYQKFSSGDPDTSKTAASWFGACIFLILVGTVLESFFF